MGDDHDRGSGAASRSRAHVWIDLAKRVRGDAKRDDVSLVAAGVAFYAFFALFPGIAALVAVYGLVSDPSEVESQMAALDGVMPVAVLDIVRGELARVASTPGRALGWGFALTLLVAIWSASKGARGLVRALNIAYGAEERRGLVRRTGLVLLFTVGGVLGAIVALALIVGVPALIHGLGLGTTGAVLAQVARFALLLGLVVSALAVIYRYAPARRSKRWRWVSPGAALAALILLLVSIGFSIYVELFGNYPSTFGSLAAVAILLLWFFLGALAIVLGGEVNAAIEQPRSTSA